MSVCRQVSGFIVRSGGGAGYLQVKLVHLDSIGLWTRAARLQGEGWWMGRERGRKGKGVGDREMECSPQTQTGSKGGPQSKSP